MRYISVAETAKKWGLTDRMVRRYCSEGRVPGAFMTGKTWNIPLDASPPGRVLPTASEISDGLCFRIVRSEREDVKISGIDLLSILKEERNAKLKGGIYHKVQIGLTYNSNHIEGSKLTEDQTRRIFETNTIGTEDGDVDIDDIVETVNHFRCIDHIIDNAEKELTEEMIKTLHLMLKTGTSDSGRSWFKVGDYKLRPNEVGGEETCHPADVGRKMKELLNEYNSISSKTVDDIIDFHHRFERIHPFQDGNGRVGRLIMFKECLSNGIVPFIVGEEYRWYYYRGLKEWEMERGFLRDTCLAAQDEFRKWLAYFEIDLS